MKFEIKSWATGAVLFSLETESMRLCVEAAIKSKTYLSYADLRSADLRYANLSSANLRSANLRSADLSSADLSYADLRSADLSYADLSYADLRYANLSSANLSSANLRSANLSYADLRSANLSYANLSYADLRSANLSYANLSYALGINKHLQTPLLMLLDQPGEIVAYKLVTDKWTGPTYPGIIYKIGKTYEEPDACTSETEHCAKGLNVATLDWCMKEWSKDYHILRVQFTAKDIAAIPTATDGKFRVKRMTIINEVDLTAIGLVEPSPIEGGAK